ncbi:Dual specificity phosphatase, catalytic domain [Dillenia turbinata]|uniref:Dual specificity phosphatase, catalytic domain n=1 Tax=Dillenia turbinata TaxID=194707 RepID=A0AAN8WCA0_9MAGN
MLLGFELLKTQGISRLLNTVPSCQNLYKNSFTHRCLQDDKSLPFDDAVKFLEQCEKDKARALAHCMSGKNRSPAIVIAYLMKCKGRRLTQSYQWVKEQKPKIIGSNENLNPALPVFPSLAAPSFTFGFPKTDNPFPAPAFNNIAAPSIFAQPSLDVPPQEFQFGASQNISKGPFGANPPNSSNNDIPMDG